MVNKMERYNRQEYTREELTWLLSIEPYKSSPEVNIEKIGKDLWTIKSYKLKSYSNITFTLEEIEDVLKLHYDVSKQTEEDIIKYLKSFIIEKLK